VILPFIRHTGRLWRVVLGWTLIAAGLVTIYGCLAGWFGKQSDETFAALVISANVVNIAACVWMIRSIRCPRCRLQLFWHALRAKEHPAGLGWFHSFTACPGCRWDAGSPSAVQPRPIT
jgi:hypothetical protein